MNTTTRGPVAVGEACLPRYPIPRSTAIAEIRRTLESCDIVWWEGPTVSVRCGGGDCTHRLFDVILSLRQAGSHLTPDGSLRLDRACPSCRRFNRCWVTLIPGLAPAGEQAFTGPWTCVCSRSLGHVDAVRGRIEVTCRCRTEHRIVAAHAVAVLYEHAGVPFDVSGPLR